MQCECVRAVALLVYAGDGGGGHHCRLCGGQGGEVVAVTLTVPVGAMRVVVVAIGITAIDVVFEMERVVVVRAERVVMLLVVEAERVAVVVKVERVTVVGVTAVHGRVEVVMCSWYSCRCE